MKEIDLWNFAFKKLSENIPLALLIVAETNKSSPAKAGFKMIIADDGEFIGTIGGGIMEYRLLQEARENLSSRRDFCYVKELYHTRNAPINPSGLICGGTQTMIIRSVTRDLKSVVLKIVEAISKLETGYFLISNKEFVFIPKQNPASKIHFEYKSEGNWEYQENISAPFVVNIIGGGHVGASVAKIMSELGLYVVIIDPREGIGHKYNCDKFFNIPYNEAGKYIIQGERSFVVVVTSEHDSDLEALNSVLGKNIRYIGLMGSKAKISSIFKKLTEKGFEPALIKSIHAPIGIKINAELPEEIAVSIAAEIINIKNGKS